MAKVDDPDYCSKSPTGKHMWHPTPGSHKGSAQCIKCGDYY